MKLKAKERRGKVRYGTVYASEELQQKKYFLRKGSNFEEKSMALFRASLDGIGFGGSVLATTDC